MSVKHRVDHTSWVKQCVRLHLHMSETRTQTHRRLAAPQAAPTSQSTYAKVTYVNSSVEIRAAFYALNAAVTNGLSWSGGNIFVDLPCNAIKTCLRTPSVLSIHKKIERRLCCNISLCGERSNARVLVFPKAFGAALSVPLRGIILSLGTTVNSLLTLPNYLEDLHVGSINTDHMHNMSD